MMSGIASPFTRGEGTQIPGFERLLVRLRLAAVLTVAVPLGACAWFSPDGGMNTVAGIADETLRKDVIAIRSAEDAAVARTRIDQLLRRPLTVEAAVQVALLNNRGLQAAYNELSLAEADMVEASLPPNPTFADLAHCWFERVRIRGTGHR